MPNTTPYETLLELERRCLTGASGLPQQAEVQNLWSGIGFRMAGTNYVVPPGEVVEVLPVPTFTNIPMTRSWVKGVANVRGSLVPVMDLHELLLGDEIKVGNKARLMIVTYRDSTVGFLSEEVMGLRHFIEEEKTSVLPSIDSRVRPFLRSAFWQGGEYWGVFSMYRLMDSTQFMDVAV